MILPVANTAAAEINADIKTLEDNESFNRSFPVFFVILKMVLTLNFRML